jgi:hypothetical protein
MKGIQMDIPTAAEAAASVSAGEYEKAKKQSADIACQITDAIAGGNYSIGGSGRLEPVVKTKLEELGYKCETGSQYNESYWSISWKG